MEKNLYPISLSDLVDLHHGPEGSEFFNEQEEKYPGISERIKKEGMNASPIEDDKIFRVANDENVIHRHLPRKLIKDVKEIDIFGNLFLF